MAAVVEGWQNQARQETDSAELILCFSSSDGKVLRLTLPELGQLVRRVCPGRNSSAAAAISPRRLYPGGG